MKREYKKKIILGILLVSLTLALVKTAMPLLFGSQYVENEIFILALLKSVFIAVTIYTLKRERFINWKYTCRNIVLTSIITLLLIYLSWNHINNRIYELKSDISNYDHFSYALNCLTTGIFEEFFFRILVFVYLCKIMEENINGSYLKPILWTSFLFAIVHLTGFFIGQIDLLSVINQMMFAFLIGIFFQSLFYRYNNIFLVAILHATVNYNGMLNQKLFRIQSETTNQNFLIEFAQTIITFILFGLIIVLPVAYYSLKNRNNSLIKD